MYKLKNPCANRDFLVVDGGGIEPQELDGKLACETPHSPPLVHQKYYIITKQLKELPCGSSENRSESSVSQLDLPSINNYSKNKIFVKRVIHKELRIYHP